MSRRVAGRPDEYRDVKPLLTSLASLDSDDPARDELRQAVITRCLPLAEHIARRFDGRGEPFDDLVQVARLGLVNAVDRFDVDRGSDFLAFAVPTMMGEVRRHFRDTGWAVRVPRHLKELHLEIDRAASTLTQRLGRSPTTGEMATELGVGKDEILLGLQAASGFRTLSIDGSPGGSGADAGRSLADVLGAEDGELALVEDHEALRVLLENLSDRERTVLLLRFFGNQTQTQIADRIGVSQMHVSRILAYTVAKLREQAER